MIFYGINPSSHVKIAFSKMTVEIVNLMGFYGINPSGYVNIAMENDHKKSGVPIKQCVFPKKLCMSPRGCQQRCEGSASV